ncbi:hypothetical protein EBAPG3_010625 [Nitrosospira lacus]|uniref:Uncharacterized protein n=1 Tax=Nitrosospira lacus TaxID=1288494 RepID=A0A1W6SQW2_9PROT|nr:hypothetical protein EBAPG3_010625 [Nitrosospira lacus]
MVDYASFLAIAPPVFSEIAAALTAHFGPGSKPRSLTGSPSVPGSSQEHRVIGIPGLSWRYPIAPCMIGSTLLPVTQVAIKSDQHLMLI